MSFYRRVDLIPAVTQTEVQACGDGELNTEFCCTIRRSSSCIPHGSLPMALQTDLHIHEFIMIICLSKQEGGFSEDT